MVLRFFDEYETVEFGICFWYSVCVTFLHLIQEMLGKDGGVTEVRWLGGKQKNENRRTETGERKWRRHVLLQRQM